VSPPLPPPSTPFCNIRDDLLVLRVVGIQELVTRASEIRHPCVSYAGDPKVSQQMGAANERLTGNLPPQGSLVDVYTQRWVRYTCAHVRLTKEKSKMVGHSSEYYEQHVYVKIFLCA
jgi:hypothetical protein